jgi:hypothetical protein
LLFQVATSEKDSANRVSLAAKFFDSCTTAQALRLATLAERMLGDAKPQENVAAQAGSITQIMMLVGRVDDATAWSKLLRGDDQKNLIQKITPQRLLLQAAKDESVEADLTRWVEAGVAAADTQSDAKAAREALAANLLLLNAAGVVVPDALWVYVIDAPRNEKRVALSPVLLERLRAAADGGRRGEVIVLAAGLAQEGEIALPIAVEITRALRQVGLKTEAVRFAQQNIALLASKN